jgi:hypothetical protein
LTRLKKGNKNEYELKKRLDYDYYMFCVVRECYGSLKSIVKTEFQKSPNVNLDNV